MRVLHAFDKPVRTVALSPDGRFVAATAGSGATILGWHSGEEFDVIDGEIAISQLAFTTDGEWMVFATRGGMVRWASGRPAQPIHVSPGTFSGGIAVSPDGKTLVATLAGTSQNVMLEQWELPAMRQKSGTDFWSPFDRLAFSPNGQHIAGINREVFELRYAASGGLNDRVRVRAPRRSSGFFTFPRDSETVVFGWGAEFQIMETGAGNILKRVASPGQPYLDAAFLGSGQHLATVDGSPLMRMWSADSWEVVRTYDWSSGGLTCITSTADGLAGVCGTNNGNLVVFDVDE